nr:sulfonate ABC transporter substrate-binding protein [Gloeobacter kilaueensis]
MTVCLLFACGFSASAEVTLRIGYQKSGYLTILKERGNLEKRLAPQGVTVRWIEFTSGPPLMEALRAGSLDLGHAGESPPIFSQAAGADLVYLASTKPSPESVAILVPKDSPVKRIADLKGKKVAVGKATSGHYLLVQALTAAGLKPEDIQWAYLSPADARAAFARGSVDAWSIWDPFYAAAQKDLDARVLTTGKNLSPFREFYLANRAFVQSQPALIKPILEEIQKTADWAQTNPQAVAKLLAPEYGIDLGIVELAEKRKERYGALPIKAPVIAEQQQVADTYFRLGLIPKAIDIKSAVWSGK